MWIFCHLCSELHSFACQSKKKFRVRNWAVGTPPHPISPQPPLSHTQPPGNGRNTSTYKKNKTPPLSLRGGVDFLSLSNWKPTRVEHSKVLLFQPVPPLPQGSLWLATTWRDGDKYATLFGNNEVKCNHRWGSGHCSDWARKQNITKQKTPPGSGWVSISSVCPPPVAHDHYHRVKHWGAKLATFISTSWDKTV